MGNPTQCDTSSTCTSKNMINAPKNYGVVMFLKQAKSGSGSKCDKLGYQDCAKAPTAKRTGTRARPSANKSSTRMEPARRKATAKNLVTKTARRLTRDKLAPGTEGSAKRKRLSQSARKT